MRAAALAVTTVLALAGCSAATDEDLQVIDPWVRSETGEMTAMFGAIQNNTGEELVIERVETDVAETVEMHEMVENESGTMVMQEKESGFVIPAGGALILEPGGEHFMLIGLEHELLAGEVVTVTVFFADGDPLAIEATVKDFTGGNEPYGEDSDHGDHSDHGDDSEHDEHDSDDHEDEHGDH